MHRDHVDLTIAAAIDGRHLLDHPFYRRWEQGELGRGELASYAEQYRSVERELPSVLRSAVERLPAGDARDLVAANLADEESDPEPHATLFESFAQAVGARPDVTPSQATGQLVALQRTAAAAGPATALAVVSAYEVQAADVARTKSRGLAHHYGVDRQGTRFWDVHAAMEADHAAWSLDAIALLDPDPDEVAAAAGASARAWWAFLDEREALASATA
jgi:pyrroloquinoline-quinone synthase